MDTATRFPEEAPRMPRSEEERVEVLARLARADPWLMEVMRTVRALELGQWCVAAGTVRNLVWDRLHGHAEPTRGSDVDVLFFDAHGAAPSEGAIEQRLSALWPGVPWEAVNQATVHRYTGEAPYSSIEHAMSRWAELATAVGVRLTDEDAIEVVAPAGLGDLFALRVRANLVAPGAAEVYRRRVRLKAWQERWPRLVIEPL